MDPRGCRNYHYRMMLFSLKRCIHLLMTTCLVLVGCNQSPKEIEPDHKLTSDEINAGISCNQVNTVRGFLLHRNFILAAECFGWKQNFPNLYRALTQVDREAWDHLLIEVDRFYISDFQRRDQYLAHFKRLDSDESLDDLARILGAATDTNLNDIIFRILSNQSNLGQRVEREKLKEVLNVLNARPKTIRSFANMFKIMNQALDGEGKDIFSVFLPLITKPDFRDARLQLLDAVATTFKDDNLSGLEKFIIKRLLRVQNQHGRLWLYDWIQDLSKTPETFVKLLNYSNKIHPSSFTDYENLMNLLPELGCYNEGNYVGIRIDVEEKIRNFVKGLTEKTLIDFVSETNSIAAEVYIANESCEMDEAFSNNSIKVLSTMQSVMNLLSDEEIFRLLGFLHRNVFDGEDEFSEDGTLFFLEFHNGRTYRATARLNDVIINKYRNKFFIVLLNILKDVAELGYHEFAFFIDTALRDENLKTIEAIGDIWLQLNGSEKEAFLNLIDVFFSEGINYVVLLNFFEKFVDDLEVFIPKIARSLTADDAKKEKTLNALLEISSKFQGQAVLEDARRLLSRDEIISIVENLSNAANPQLAPPSIDPISSEINLPPLDTIVYDEVLRCEENQDPTVCAEVYRCFRQLSDDTYNLYTLAQDPSLSCLNIKASSFGLRIIQYLNLANQKYKQYFNDDLIAENGFLNPKVLSESQKNLAALHKIPHEEHGNYLQYIIDTIENQLFHLVRVNDGYGYLSNFENIMSFMASAIDLENEDFNQTIYKLKTDLADLDSEEIKEYFDLLTLALREYPEFEYVTPTYVEENSCEQTFKQEFRYDACASNELIKRNSKRILEILGRKYDGKKSPAELLVRAFHPESGLEIPTQDESGKDIDINYVMDIRNFLYYTYDTYTNGESLNFYTSKDDFKFSPYVSYAEMTELVITEASFYGNYFGLFYLNSVTKAHDYQKQARKNKDVFNLVKKCVNGDIPIIGLLCKPLSRWLVGLPKLAQWWSKNAINTFDSLIVVDNEYQHSDGIYRHGNFLKTFLAAMVNSSPDKAQYTQTLNIPTKRWEFIHNGEIIFRMAELGAFKNFGRFFTDRISGDKSEFDAFVNSYQVKRVNDRLLKSMPLEDLISTVENLLTELGGENGELEQSIDKLIDWIGTLKYSELRRLEKMLANILVIGTYLGPDLEDKDFRSFGTRYSGNNLIGLIKTLDHFIPFFNQVFDLWPSENPGIDILLKLEKPIAFFKKNLLPEADKARRQTYYQLLNKTYKILERAALKSGETSGTLAIAKMVKADPSIVGKFEKALDSGIEYVERIGLKYNGSGFVENKFRYYELADFIDKLSSNEFIDSENLREYILNTEKQIVEGEPNPDYRKDRKIIKLLAIREDGKTLLEAGLRTSFVDDKNLLRQFINEVFPLINFNPVAPGSGSVD